MGLETGHWVQNGFQCFAFANAFANASKSLAPQTFASAAEPKCACRFIAQHPSKEFDVAQSPFVKGAMSGC